MPYRDPPVAGETVAVVPPPAREQAGRQEPRGVRQAEPPRRQMEWQEPGGAQQAEPPRRQMEWQEPRVEQRVAPNMSTTVPLYQPEFDDVDDEPVVERAPRRRNRRSWRPNAVARAYERLGRTLSLLAALAIGVFLWYIGAMYSLAFISSLDTDASAAIRAAGGWAWFIPVGISVIEIFMFPQAERSVVLTLLRAVFWVGILLFDVYSTYQGFVPWLMARGVANVTVGSAAGVIFGIACAFIPERTFRWVVVEFYEMWVIPLSKLLGLRLVQIS